MSRVGRTVLYGLLAFVVVTAGLLAIFGGPGGRRAVLFSAGLALAVQVIAFCMTRFASSEKLFQAWGAGAVLRLFTLVLYALVLVKPLGLAPVAALLSLATLLFVTTVLESWLLTS